jgi:hypothetical protein
VTQVQRGRRHFGERREQFDFEEEAKDTLSAAIGSARNRPV